MFDDLPVLLLVPHADAGDRAAWTLDQDLRPLTAEGRAQAAALAETIGVVDRIVSSPARRCVETVEPIAAVSNIDIELSDDLRELTFVEGDGGWGRWPRSNQLWWGQLLAGAGLGRFLRVIAGTRGAGRRVVISAHGDLVPLFAVLAAGHLGVPAPVPIARGGCFEVDVTDPEQPIRSLGSLLPPPLG